MRADVTFEAETHTYRGPRGDTWPSVTSCLTAPKPYYTDESRDRGSAVHDAVLADRGVTEANVEGYLRSLARLPEVYPHRLDTILRESLVFDPELRVAGTLDWLLRVDGRPAIFDLKTGAVESWHGLQTAGYARLAKACGLLSLFDLREIEVRAAVYIKADGGKPSIITHDNPRDDERFVRAVAQAWRERRACSRTSRA